MLDTTRAGLHENSDAPSKASKQRFLVAIWCAEQYYNSHICALNDVYLAFSVYFKRAFKMIRLFCLEVLEMTAYILS